MSKNQGLEHLSANDSKMFTFCKLKCKQQNKKINSPVWEGLETTNVYFDEMTGGTFSYSVLSNCHACTPIYFGIFY